MPTVHFRGREIECEPGAVLRDVLCEAGAAPHNGRAALLNCHGHGTCGTCAVEIEGETSGPTARERTRLSVPPHDPDDGLRLACRTPVEGDLTVRKHPGLGASTSTTRSEPVARPVTRDVPGARPSPVP